MESSCTLPAPAAPVAERVIDLATRVRAARDAARQFLQRYAIEAAAAPAHQPVFLPVRLNELPIRRG